VPITEKNFENRIIVGEVMAKSLVSCYLTHGVEGSTLILEIPEFPYNTV